MNKVTIGVNTRDAINQRIINAAESGEPQGAYIDFLSEAELFKTITLKRWQILKNMTGAGELSIREVARRVERDVKAVHSDITALLQCGILDKTDNGKVVFPYEAVHVDFMLQAA